MSYPAGVQTVTLRLGSSFDSAGTLASITGHVVPLFGAGADHLVWGATGQTYAKARTALAWDDAEKVAFATVPHPTQAGWRDQTQASFSGWSYQITAVAAYAGGERHPFERTVTPQVGDTVIDVDLLPNGAAATPTVVAEWEQARADALAALAAAEVEQVTLTEDLAYTLPAGVAPNRTHSVVFTQDATGGRKVTFAGSGIPLDMRGGMATTVQFAPKGGKWSFEVLAPTRYTASSWTPGSTVRPLGADVSQLVAFGSSSMHGVTARLPKFVPLPWGLTIKNACQGGERIEHNLARLGITPAVLNFPGNVVPASGPVTMTTSLPNTYSMATYRGTIQTAGGPVVGTLALAYPNFTWTRETAGTATTVAGPVEFIPTDYLADGVTPAPPIMRDRVTLIQIGKNSIPDTPVAAICGTTGAIIDWLVPRRKLVGLMGMFNGSSVTNEEREEIAQVNAFWADLAASDPDVRYADVQSYVVGDQIWADTGIRPTASDLAQQASGVKPASLSLDAQHLNEAGYNAVASRVVLPMLADLLSKPHPIPPEVVTSDTFTGGDAASISGRATDLGLGGTAKTWVGGWAISGGNLVVPQVVSGVWLPQASMDQQVTAKLTAWTSSSTAHLVVRARTATADMANNSYRLNLWGQAPRIDKRYGGVNTSLGNLPVALGAGDVVTLRASGSTITAFVNGAPVLEVTDTDIPAGSYVGMEKSDTAAGGQVQAITVRTFEPIMALSDDFTGDMASIVGRETDSAFGGTPTLWSGSAWATTGGRLAIPTTAGGVWLPNTSPDQEVSARFSAGWNGAASLVLRSSSSSSSMANNGYRLNCWWQAPRIDKRYGGSDTSLGNLPSGSIKDGDVMTLRVRGTTVQALVNGVPVLTVQDSDIPSGSYVGIAKSTSTSTGYMEYFKLRTYRT